MTITPEQIQRWREMHNGELRLFRLSNPAGKELLDEIERLMKVEEAANKYTERVDAWFRGEPTDTLDIHACNETLKQALQGG